MLVVLCICVLECGLLLVFFVVLCVFDGRVLVWECGGVGDGEFGYGYSGVGMFLCV